MGRMQNTALWTSLENFLHQNYGHEHEGKEIIRLVGELRMGGRLNGGDIFYLKEIIKFSRVAGMKVARKALDDDESSSARLLAIHEARHKEE